MRSLRFLSGLLLAAVMAASAARAEHYSRDGQSWCAATDPRLDLDCAPLAGEGIHGRSYAAIAATSGAGDFYGYASGLSTRAGAEQEALRRCESRGGRPGSCRIATWFFNECGALATGASGRWGADWGDTTTEASRKAMANCWSHDGSGACHVVTTFCSR